MTEISQHYDILIFKGGKLIDRFAKAHDIELDSCVTFEYPNDSGIEVMVTYPLENVSITLEWRGEW